MSSVRPEREESERDLWRLSERDRKEGKERVRKAREALMGNRQKENSK